MTNSTPGPWTVEAPMSPDGYAIVQDGLEAHEWQFIATVSVGIPAEGLMPRQEAKANAQLIATAPELLAALKKLLGSGFITLCNDGDLDAARATVAKAEGR